MKKKEKDPAVYIWDMLYEIEIIEKAMQTGNLDDVIIGHAVLRCFTVIGEACKRVNDEVKIKNNHIPWQKIVSIRNILSHEYEEINLKIISVIISDDLPALKNNLLILYKTLTGTDYHAN